MPQLGCTAMTHGRSLPMSLCAARRGAPSRTHAVHRTAEHGTTGLPAGRYGGLTQSCALHTTRAVCRAQQRSQGPGNPRALRAGSNAQARLLPPEARGRGGPVPASAVLAAQSLLGMVCTGRPWRRCCSRLPRASAERKAQNAKRRTKSARSRGRTSALVRQLLLGARPTCTQRSRGRGRVGSRGGRAGQAGCGCGRAAVAGRLVVRARPVGVPRSGTPACGDL